MLYTNCSCRGRMSDFLSFAVVDREWSSFAARLWRELSFLSEPHWHYSTQQMRNLRVPSISTYFLSWPSKNKFRATFLQMLSMWGCHFNPSSIVIPRTLCSQTCLIMFVPSVRLSIRGLSWCFCLEANTMLFQSLSSWGILPCDFGHTILMRFWSHHFDASFKPSWRLWWTDSTFVPHEWIKLLSAKDHIQLWY